MHTAALLLAAFGFAFVFRDRPVLAVCITFVVWALLPSVAAETVTAIGGTKGLKVHPSTLAALCVAIVSLLYVPRTMLRPARDHPYAVMTIGIVVVGAAVTTELNHSHGLSLLGDQILGPVAVFWLVVAHASGDRAGLQLVRRTIIGVAVFESLFALAQYLTHSVLVFGSDYATLPWFDPATYSRWMGTTDSPLVLSLLLCVAAPLVVTSSGLARPALLSALLFGVLIAQSRVGSATLALVVVYLLVRSKMSWTARGFYLIILGVAGYVLAHSGLANGVSDRLANDAGSSQARLLAWQTFGHLFRSLMFTGDGLTANYLVAQADGLGTSFESSFLMYAVDIGFVLTVAYFGVQVVLLVRSIPGTMVPGAAVGGLVGFFVQQTFSAVGFSNVVGPLLWLVIGLAVAAAPSTGARVGAETVRLPELQPAEA